MQTNDEIYALKMMISEFLACGQLCFVCEPEYWKSARSKNAFHFKWTTTIGYHWHCPISFMRCHFGPGRKIGIEFFIRSHSVRTSVVFYWQAAITLLEKNVFLVIQMYFDKVFFSLSQIFIFWHAYYCACDFYYTQYTDPHKHSFQ